MVLIPLKKIDLRSHLNTSVPHDFPNWMDLILNHFYKEESKISDTSTPQVSIKVAAKYEEVPQKSIEGMESAKRETVLKSLIKVLLLKKEHPNTSLTEYFIFPKTSCIVCNLEGLKMNLHYSGRAVKRATLYKTDGAVDCYFVMKECWGCGASHYPSYVEWQEDTVKKRKFFTDGGKYFGVTSDTFFTQAFLKETE